LEFAVSAEDSAFREDVRDWLRANMPSEPRPPITAGGSEQSAYMRQWQRRLFDGGWAGISWPKEYGGRGLSLSEQIIWLEEYARAGAPEPGCLFCGLQHAGPTLIVKSTAEQKAYHLPRILSGEDIWCQGFSEPGAGSDLAAISTRGIVEGDHIVVNGSKIWTSFAQIADYQELLIRTEPGSSRHKGLTWLICDMRTPGITVRPIRSLDGEHHNCEVFYDNVRIPLKNVVGEVNQGWSVAMATLSFERGTAFMETQVRLAFTVEKLIAMAREQNGPGGCAAIEQGDIAERLGQLRARAASLRAMAHMCASRAKHSEIPGPEGTLIALRGAEMKQDVYRLAMDILGTRGFERPTDFMPEQIVQQYLYSYASTVGGGTTEIRRNIIAERVLGLPRHG
jgi:alkylation response protein AidB-like acyl-CoA dehydrogenase